MKDQGLGRALTLARSVLEKLPGGDRIIDGADQVERAVLVELQQRLHSVDADGYSATAGSSGGEPTAADEDLLRRATVMRERNQEQSSAAARSELYSVLLSQLVSDELSILGAMSDGHPHALLHVGAGSRTGIGGVRRVAHNFCKLKGIALIKAPELVPFYVGHLRQLGLLHTAPEDSDLEIQYQVLEGEAAVRDVVAEIESESGATARHLRRVLKITTVGAGLWNACATGEVQC